MLKAKFLPYLEALFAVLVWGGTFISTKIATWLMAASTAVAATFTLHTTADLTDAVPGDGTCETATGNGLCSLRAAILEANALAGPDTIIVPAGTYALGIPGDLENGGLTGDLDVTDSVTLRGAGRSSTILDGAGIDRVLDVDAGGLPITVEISSLTIQGGTPLRDEPIGGYVRGGGGILVRGGDVRLADVTLRDNRIDTLIAAGGDVHNNGDLTLTRCVLTGNRAYYGGGGFDGPAVLVPVAGIPELADKDQCF